MATRAPVQNSKKARHSVIVPEMSTAQLRAATSNAQLSYVNAGPGSGKTFLASEAFGYLRFVRHRHAAAGVVGVTFARSARRELENRIRVRWGARSVGWPNSVCTFDEMHRRLLRYLISQGLIVWPGGALLDRPLDSWALHPGATSKPGKKRKCFLTLDEEGLVSIGWTTSKLLAPNPAFTDRNDFLSALTDGHCTHNEIRNVLAAAMDGSLHPRFADAIRECLAGSVCHLVVDEAFDMNLLDTAVVQAAIDANVPVTVVGDPWQSLYEFRGSSPSAVQKLLVENRFLRIDMPGSHRYSTCEMLKLASALFRGEPFQVLEPADGEEFDVVLAHDWSALWAEDRISVLPAGVPSKLDRGRTTSAFVLLLGEVVQAQFGIESSGLVAATRVLEPSDLASQLEEPLALLRDSAATEDDIWSSLKGAFGLPCNVKKHEPKKLAKRCLRRLMDVVRHTDHPALGLTVHQAKGLEWERVLFLDGALSVSPRFANVLDVNEGSHRSVYVALTRARSSVRVLKVVSDPYGAQPSQIHHVAV